MFSFPKCFLAWLLSKTCPSNFFRPPQLDFSSGAPRIKSWHLPHRNLKSKIINQTEIQINILKGSVDNTKSNGNLIPNLKRKLQKCEIKWKLKSTNTISNGNSIDLARKCYGCLLCSPSLPICVGSFGPLTMTCICLVQGPKGLIPPKSRSKSPRELGF